MSGSASGPGRRREPTRLVLIRPAPSTWAGATNCSVITPRSIASRISTWRSDAGRVARDGGRVDRALGDVVGRRVDRAGDDQRQVWHQQFAREHARGDRQRGADAGDQHVARPALAREAPGQRVDESRCSRRGRPSRYARSGGEVGAVDAGHRRRARAAGRDDDGVDLVRRTAASAGRRPSTIRSTLTITRADARATLAS